jgi:hypothetical protein
MGSTESPRRRGVEGWGLQNEGSMSGSGDVGSKGRRSRTGESGSGGVGSKGLPSRASGNGSASKSGGVGFKG